ncbi:PRC-barrel domain-containing protein [Gilvimarinus sp. DA14]|uniref:PRC-barrel domain-containing protein n=1 Tax=Gilvimarinus sp. DA14 TaxID=2956798 RepID=UPI0020B81C94|nr:PRC-barrel domain-containing protein [Gilvimarinus sp. DA14]UTF60223.1 PRC-barrel domain-containing protein [Gilvimarinus sp. DA14]
MKYFQKLALPAVLATSIASSAFAAEGLYSMSDLEEAKVYDSAGEEVGEVEDILLGNNMSVHSLVIETGEVMGLGGNELVIKRGSFTVVPKPDHKNFDEIEYKVHLEMTQSELKAQPEYTEDWWNKTSAALQRAWEKTKDVSESAWENTKEATSSAWHDIEEGAEDLGDEIEKKMD